MTTQIQRRRGTTAQHSTFTGANGEVTVDTDKEVLVVHDGAQAGGYPQMRENGSNSALALGSAATPSLKFTGDTNTGIYSPGADQVAISTNGSRRLLIDSTGALTLDTGDATIYGVRVGRGGGAIATNTVVGSNALIANTTGTNNVANGLSALQSNTTGTFNVASGPYALYLNTTANQNVAVGYSALEQNVSGTNNAAVGFRALINNTGSANTCIGSTAGNSLTTGNGNTIIGNIPGTAGLSNTVIIGAGEAERLRIDSNGRLGLGTSVPWSLASVAGSGTAGDVTSARQISAGTSSTYNVSLGYYQTGSSQPFAGVIQALDGGAGTRLLLNPSGGNVGIGTTSPNQALHVAGNAQIGAADANPTWIELGAGATGNRAAFLDFTGDTTYTDYGLRVERTSGGANGTSQILHRGTGDLRIVSQEAGPIAFWTTNTERARLTADGKLLVGTSTARSTSGVSDWQLQIEKSSAFTGASIVANSNDVYGAYLILGKTRGTSNGSNTIVQNGDRIGEVAFVAADGDDTNSVGASIVAFVDGTPGANDMPSRLVFSTTADGASNPTERVRISSTGQAYVVSTYYAFTAISTEAAGTSAGLFEGKHSGTAGLITGATTSFIVWTNGNVVNTNNSYGAISDIKLKENIVDANSQWDDLKALQVRKYNFKEGQTHTQIGLVAQEVELVSPGLVSESPDRDEDGNDLGTVTKSVNYSVLYMKAVKALQEAMERIETLEAKVAALEGQ
jgi:hypothetical protein